MSGHSKWATIKHKKAALDAKQKDIIEGNFRVNVDENTPVSD